MLGKMDSGCNSALNCSDLVHKPTSEPQFPHLCNKEMGKTIIKFHSWRHYFIYASRILCIIYRIHTYLLI